MMIWMVIIIDKRDRMRKDIIIIILIQDVKLIINKIKMRMEEEIWKGEVDLNQEREDIVQVKVLS